ncbi:thrombomodulin-like [Stegostoma tigrinum]|uniref:thrombomodulin-like n=1 Tax=Stegostoma tigrinum TaxID=3053191 RepID=UPI002870565A|nr:thrombomodulin-like [Stegostoma tigrinum]
MLLLLCLCLSAVLVHGVQSSQPAVQEPTASVCVATVCYSLQQERRKFNMARNICKNGGGDAMTIVSTVAAEAIAVLLGGGGGEMRGVRPHRTGGETEKPTVGGRVERPSWTGGGVAVTPPAQGNFWIGLQLHHKACPGNDSLLRGYRWVNGEAAANYSQWGVTSGECGPRCVTVSASGMWEERACNQKADGVLCEYRYQGSCGHLRADNASVTYRTPFAADGGHLSELPAGTQARVAPWGLEFTCSPGQAGDARASWRAKALPPWACRVENGGCQHLCSDSSLAGPVCGCQTGYTLGEDKSSCRLHDPCQEARCQHHCIVQNGTPFCLCWDGYTLDDDGKSCTDVDECQQRPCEQVCVNTPGNFSCHCFSGYQLGTDNKCEDINECWNANSCAHLCANTPGSYSCSCYSGYHIDPFDFGACVFYCEAQTDPCDPRCVGSECYCPVGYIYDDVRETCHDIDECAAGECDMTCTNTYGSYKCDCKEGFVLQEDGATCEIEGSGSSSPPLPTTISPDVVQPGQAGVSLVVVLGSIFAIAILTLVFAGLAHHLLAKRGKWKASGGYKPTNTDMDLSQVTSVDEQKQRLQCAEVSGVAT